MSGERYNMSFTTGGLFRSESLALAQMFLSLGDWDAVRQKVVAENVLQLRTISSSTRVCREVVFRLKRLTAAELALLVEADQHEQGYLLWLAVCRHHRFIAEFAVEVIRERYITLNSDLRHEDFDAFFNQKSDWHPELEKIQPATRKKLRQVLFRILREAELLTPRHTIHAALLTPGLIKLITNHNHRELIYFPVFESDLRGAPQ